MKISRQTTLRTEPQHKRRLLISCCLAALWSALPQHFPRAAESPDQVLTNSIGMKLIQIQPGSFQRGSTQGDFDERPVHQATLPQSFYMAATEVSNAQYELFDPQHRSLRGKAGFSNGDDEAVVFVNWHDAVAFCEWLSRKEGAAYRLPTEAEWEYACRAGTTTPFHTGAEWPEEFHKHQKQEWNPVPVNLRVGLTPANPWGLHDMHGNVEEWCSDWYGPYSEAAQTSPGGPLDGDFKVTRGGSHNTPVAYLRSSNRSGTLPENKHWLIGFRVVRGVPLSQPSPKPQPELWARNVNQERHAWPRPSDPSQPFFAGPKQYVFIPPNSEGPLFSRHNHQPAITECPNGDLLAIWYTCRTEAGRELGVVASRLRRGAEEWEPAAPFWDAPDRNDHGNALWWDGKQTLYHFNGLGTDGTWGKLALIMRSSEDNGTTWSKAKLIHPEHGLRQQVIAGVFQTRAGEIVVPCDAVTGGHGGTAVHIGTPGGRAWRDPGAGLPAPIFAAQGTGAWIAGIHAGVAELADGRWMALGRGDSINGRMPLSLSKDRGTTWEYSDSGLPAIGGGQRLVLRRLREGPLFLASFTTNMTVANAAGQPMTVSGLYGALSFDEGQTWPVRRLITDSAPAREVDGGGNTGRFQLGPVTAEPKGYLACTQSPDNRIHLISSKQHYVFNLAWLQTPMPPASPSTPSTNPAAPAPTGATDSDAAQKALETRFKETLSGSVLAGRWRLVTDGKLGEEREEKYTIQNAAKMGKDVWLIYARVQYGNKDVTVPIPVEVKWAGDTPVISITKMNIPGLGAYTARVVIYDRMYTGTWSGPDVGGLLHGVIQKPAASSQP